MRNGFFVAAVSLLLIGCAASSEGENYPNIEAILIGQNLEAVAKRYGNPAAINQVGGTIFVSYSGIGRITSAYSNVCNLALQSDSTTKRITSAKLTSNLGIDGTYRGLNVRNDCNRVFSRN